MDAGAMLHPNVKPRRGPQERGSAMVDHSSTRGRRALIVDSDPASVRLCQDTLARLGFATECVSGGVDAVVAARGRVPHLIVMDSQLSDASAGETIAWLRANPSLRSVPIVVLGIVNRSRLPAKDASAMAVVGKPTTSATIERAVRGLCG